jgi:hypothetical protein
VSQQGGTAVSALLNLRCFHFGSAGGQITAVGTPEELAFRLDDNHTGRYLRPLLATR